MINYDLCRPEKCSPENGVCPAVGVCTHKVIKQLDGAFHSPMIFHDMCMGCWDCIEACPLDAIGVRQIT